MEEQCLFSFIVAVYNTPSNYLRECISSMCAIECETYEIIVVDDGSTSEETLKVLKQYDNDKHVRVIRQVNSGVSVARNTGLDKACGKYILFVDSDDSINSNIFNTVCVPLLIDYPEESMFVFTNNDIDRSSSLVRQGCNSGVRVISKHILDTYKDGIAVGAIWIREAVWAKIFKRSLIGDIRFEPGMKYGEDNLFVLQVSLELDRVICCGATLYNYRQNSGSATNRYTPTILQDRMENITKIESLFKKYGLEEKRTNFCYDVIFRTYLHLVLRLWIFNKENTISFKEKCNLAHKILSDNYFAEKLNNVAVERIRRKDKIIVTLLKKDYVYLAYKVFRLNKPKFFMKKR